MLGPPIFEVELAADGQDRVADLLGRQPPHVEPPEQVVLRVLRQRSSGSAGEDMLVGVRQQDQPVQAP